MGNEPTVQTTETGSSPRAALDQLQEKINANSKLSPEEKADYILLTSQAQLEHQHDLIRIVEATKQDYELRLQEQVAALEIERRNHTRTQQELERERVVTGQLSEIVGTDHLTGLYNRRSLEQQV